MFPDIPKPMIPIRGIPFLEFQMNSLYETGVNSFVLCIGYKAEMIIDYFSGKKLPYDIRFSVEKTQLGTGGAITNALTRMEKRFLIINGDTFVSFHLSSLLEYHKKKRSLFTVLLVKRDDTADYGTVSVDSIGKVKGFTEKSVVKGPALVNAGAYLVEKQIFSSQPPEFSLEKDLMPSLVAGSRVFGFVIDGTFIDIGTPERLLSFKRQVEL
jgi:NDP-sugar pyrophosphorylase family protein